MKCFRHTHILLLSVLAATLFFQSCHPDSDSPAPVTLAKSYDYKVFKSWNDKYTELDRYAKGNRPGTGPRALAYMGLSAYESVVAGMPEYNSLEVHYPGLSLPKVEKGVEYFWPACVNESYAFLMKKFFLQMETQYADLFGGIDQLRLVLHNQYADQAAPDVLERSEAFGKAIANAVYEWEKQDIAGHNAFLNPQPSEYQPPAGPGL